MNNSETQQGHFTQIPNVVVRARINCNLKLLLIECYSNTAEFRYSSALVTDILTVKLRTAQCFVKTLVDAKVFVPTTPHRTKYKDTPNYLFNELAVIPFLNKLAQEPAQVYAPVKPAQVYAPVKPAQEPAQAGTIKNTINEDQEEHYKEDQEEHYKEDPGISTYSGTSAGVCASSCAYALPPASAERAAASAATSIVPSAVQQILDKVRSGQLYDKGLRIP